MNKYVLSALVVPVALMGAVTAQAKTTLLKATVNQAKSGTKVVSGKATRGAKIKISRAGVTYGVAKANKHGHFVMKLKRAVKGGWTYKVTVTKAGFKVKSDHFKVKKGKKQVKVVKPSTITPVTPAPASKPSSTPATPSAPTKPIVPNAPKTSVNTRISSIDIEANQISGEIFGLNRQLDAVIFGQRKLDATQRAFLSNQIYQLQNRVNVFATRSGVSSATISSMNNELTMLRQKFNGLSNTVVLSGSTGTTKPASDVHLQNVVKTDKSASQQIAELQKQNQLLNESASKLDIQIANLNTKLETEKYLDESISKFLEKVSDELADAKEANQKRPSQKHEEYVKQIQQEYDQAVSQQEINKRNCLDALDDAKYKRQELRDQIQSNEVHIKSIQEAQKRAVTNN
ncbi:Ig-like domain-containing protein [Lentilactobacillus hilgardii]|uniref:Ig-like domain-containing protein n=1 Tax=Lentilactobacillus hilgardii TaxID=1588 RepID=UPI003FA5407E